MARIKQDTSPEAVLRFVNDASYLILRGFRSEANIRTTFWKSIISHTIVDPTILNEPLLLKKFLHIFINVETSLDALDMYFNGMSRQFWELNKNDINDFFLDQTATSNRLFLDVLDHIEKLSITYKDADYVPFNLSSILSEGKRSGQSVPEIILSNYPSELIISTESEVQILLNSAINDDEVKHIHDKMMKTCKTHLTTLIYSRYFLPFSNSPHLPFLKTK
jgi:hypothetical protein